MQYLYYHECTHTVVERVDRLGVNNCLMPYNRLGFCILFISVDLYRSPRLMRWSEEEKRRLIEVVSEHKNNDRVNWKDVAQEMPGRSPN